MGPTLESLSTEVLLQILPLLEPRTLVRVTRLNRYFYSLFHRYSDLLRKRTDLDVCIKSQDYNANVVLHSFGPARKHPKSIVFDLLPHSITDTSNGFLNFCSFSDSSTTGYYSVETSISLPNALQQLVEHAEKFIRVDVVHLVDFDDSLIPVFLNAIKKPGSQIKVIDEGHQKLSISALSTLVEKSRPSKLYIRLRQDLPRIPASFFELPFVKNLQTLSVTTLKTTRLCINDDYLLSPNLRSLELRNVCTNFTVSGLNRYLKKLHCEDFTAVTLQCFIRREQDSSYESMLLGLVAGLDTTRTTRDDGYCSQSESGRVIFVNNFDRRPTDPPEGEEQSDCVEVSVCATHFRAE